MGKPSVVVKVTIKLIQRSKARCTLHPLSKGGRAAACGGGGFFIKIARGATLPNHWLITDCGLFGRTNCRCFSGGQCPLVFRTAKDEEFSTTAHAPRSPSFRKEVAPGIRLIFLCRFIFIPYDDGSGKPVPYNALRQSSVSCCILSTVYCFLTRARPAAVTCSPVT